MPYATCDDLDIQALSILFIFFTTRTSSTMGRRQGQPARAAQWAWKTLENSVPGEGSSVLECSHECQERHAARQHRLLRIPKRKPGSTRARGQHQQQGLCIIYISTSMFSSLALYGKRRINASDSQSAHRKRIGLEWKLEELELRMPLRVIKTVIVLL